MGTRDPRVDAHITKSREATKIRRVEQAVEWIGEGKQRNWKYQR